MKPAATVTKPPKRKSSDDDDDDDEDDDYDESDDDDDDDTHTSSSGSTFDWDKYKREHGILVDDADSSAAAAAAAAAASTVTATSSNPASSTTSKTTPDTPTASKSASPAALSAAEEALKRKRLVRASVSFALSATDTLDILDSHDEAPDVDAFVLAKKAPDGTVIQGLIVTPPAVVEEPPPAAAMPSPDTATKSFGANPVEFIASKHMGQRVRYRSALTSLLAHSVTLAHHHRHHPHTRHR